MEPEKRKIMDAAITKDFLAYNQPILNMLITEFANQVNLAIVPLTA